MNSIAKNFNNKLEFIALILIFLLPIIILSGSLLANIAVLLIDLIYLWNLYKKKKIM